MSQKAVSIVGIDGQPLRPNRAMALANGGNAPYDAADIYGSHVAAWRPYLWSPDGEIDMFRNRFVARVRDLVRNDGWASGAVTRILDNAIGGHFRPNIKPDYKALARSEEHTSELQSPVHLVCRLLLEKKNLLLEQKK